jgi:predicted ATPase
MHLKRVTIHTKRYPNKKHYPFNLDILSGTDCIQFNAPVTCFVGENGTGKSTLLKALCRKCGIYIWEGPERTRVDNNPFEDSFHGAISIDWVKDPVPGCFFSSQLFKHFSQLVDEWASADPGLLDYFGGKSLLTQSHGQSLMSFFHARFQIRGIYFLDEPETALSPKSQIQLLQLLWDTSLAGHAQFIIATHSPILMSVPGANILSFDEIPIAPVDYKDTSHYKIYKAFMEDPEKFLTEK